MRRRPTYAAGLAIILLTVMGTMVATADSQPIDGLSVAPSTARPGQTVVLQVFPGCKGPPEFASAVLTIREQNPLDHSSATATVNADAKPGRYEVSATCIAGHPPQPFTRTAFLTVAQEPASVPSQKPAPHQVKQVPKGAAQTGGGGTAEVG